jgi:hypothetical protein
MMSKLEISLTHLYLEKAQKRPCLHPHMSTILNLNMMRKKWKKWLNQPDPEQKKEKKNSPRLLSLCPTF